MSSSRMFLSPPTNFDRKNRCKIWSSPRFLRWRNSRVGDIHFWTPLLSVLCYWLIMALKRQCAPVCKLFFPYQLWILDLLYFKFHCVNNSGHLAENEKLRGERVRVPTSNPCIFANFLPFNSLLTSTASFISSYISLTLLLTDETQLKIFFGACSVVNLGHMKYYHKILFIGAYIW